MVIASNEWLNNYEDEQKPASATTTATATATTTNISDSSDNNPTRSSSTSTTATSATNTVINSVISTINSTSTSPTTTTTTTNTSPATTSEGIPTAVIAESVQSVSKTAEINSNTIKPFEQLDRQQQLQQPPGVSMVNTKRPMMDDSLKSDRETNEIGNNNRDLANTAFISNSPPSANSLSNTSISTILGSSSTNIITAQTHANSNIGPSYNPSPITPQALSNALQSALSATSNNATVAVSLPNSFLCSLGNVGISPNATLQHTANLAKQLSSSLSALECQALSSSNQHGGDSNADNSMRGDHHHQQMIDNNGQAKIVLHCEPNSHPFQTRTILLTPNIECKVGRLIAKSKATESNAIFDCKVLSRNHAVLWYSNDGKFWVKDTKSSNGTFINENKLGTESAELHFGDVVKFGVDVMENSRKEVHGCIIAGVKLYLPDGRETISIELNTNQLPAHSGESRISFDELHRLNLYMQEASQREKLLKSKLYNIQNILDATRKNSALCWQSLIAEDQLLHRIHSLEKKLQLMEKNVPENVLRNEVLKLLDDKSSYQHSAKEALRKVYQERCDAMQMLSKMESAYIASDDECKILRDQIMNTKQSLQDVNTRLLGLEVEYNEFKEENDRKQQEAKEQSDQRTGELMETLKQRDLDCEELRRKISELLLKRAEMLDGDDEGDDDDDDNDDEQKLEKQAIEKLDAAIADVMDLEDDDDEDDDDEEDKNNKGDDDERDGKREDKINSNDNAAMKKQEKSKFFVMSDGPIDEFCDSTNEKEKTDAKSPKSCVLSKDGVPTKQKMGKKSTILKWLENSDLNEKEGSMDIFNAICNESDSSDGSSERGAGTNKQLENNNKSNPLNNDDNHQSEEEEGLTSKCKDFNEKLRNVQQNLSQLEAEIANETKKAETVTAETLQGEVIAEEFPTEENAEGNHDDDDDGDDNNLESEALKASLESPTKSNGSAKFNIISSNNASYMLLKSSVSMLREAYNEICENMQHQQQRQQQRKQQQRQKKETPTTSVHTKLKNYAQRRISKSAGKKLASQLTALQSSRSPEAESEEAAKIRNSPKVNEHVTGEEDDDDDVPSEATARLSLTSLQTIKEIASADEEEASENSSTVAVPVATDESSGSSNRVNSQQQQQNIDGVIKVYQYEIKELHAKLELSETDAQNTLELMQVECDTFKGKVTELSKLVETLNEEKRALEQVIAQNKSNAAKTEACFKEEPLPSIQAPAVISEKLTQSSAINKGAAADAAVDGEGATTARPQEVQGRGNVPDNDGDGDTNQQQAFEQQLQEEFDNEIEVEEELIMYKERLDQSQCENLRLRNEISEMVLATDAYTMNLLKRLLPYGVVVVAILVYFIFTYL